jgi:PAS domain S-box-containing protein
MTINPQFAVATVKGLDEEVPLMRLVPDVIPDPMPARAVGTPEETAIRTDARLARALESVTDAFYTLDRDWRYTYVNPEAERLQQHTRAELLGHSLWDVFPEVAGTVFGDTFHRAVETGETATVEAYYPPLDLWAAVRVFPSEDGLAVYFQDINERRVAEQAIADALSALRLSEDRFRAALDSLTLPALILDTQGVVLFVNRHLLARTGWTDVEVIGSNVFDWLVPVDGPQVTIEAYETGMTPDAFVEYIESTWRTRAGGQVLIGWTNSAIQDDKGEIVAVASVGEDITARRQAEATQARTQASLDSTTREREAFARTLARLQQRGSPEETGQQITDAVAKLSGIDFAVLVTFEVGEDARVLAVTSTMEHPFVVGDAVTRPIAVYLRQRAAGGAWTEGDVQNGHTEMWDTMRVWESLGMKGGAFAPIDNGDGPIGVVALGTRDPIAAMQMAERLPAAIEFAAAARSLIAGPLAARAVQTASRLRIEAIIATNAFEPLFQPIVDLKTGGAIGYEALTRFHDGTRPDLVFAEAHGAGIGIHLEVATLARAVAASSDLPAGAWLSLNVSAAMILDTVRLSPILDRRTRPIILEVTEHDTITDYQAVRASIALYGPDVRVAVDDAGAGVANFTHIVSLRPDFVKIDVGLVRGVNHDLTRQALIVGLGHFARATNAWLIAEGVETEEERRALLGLDLDFGQGLLFGPPARVSAWVKPTGPVAARRSRARLPSPALAVVPRLRKGLSPAG